jgi:hypothetical protein
MPKSMVIQTYKSYRLHLNILVNSHYSVFKYVKVSVMYIGLANIIVLSARLHITPILGVLYRVNKE